MDEHKKCKSNKILAVTNALHNVFLLIKILGRYQKIGIVIHCFMLVINVVIPLLLINYQRSLIETMELNTVQSIIAAVIAVIVVMFTQRILNIVFEAVNRSINDEIVIKLETAKYNKSSKLKLLAYDNPILFEKMQLSERISSETVTELLSSIFNLVNSLIISITFFVVLLGFSWFILVTAFIGIIPGIFLHTRDNVYEEFDKKRTPTVRRMAYFKNITNNGYYTKEIKLFGIIPFMTSRHKSYHDEWTRLELEYNNRDFILRMIIDPTIFLFHYIIPALLLILSVSNQELEIAGFVYYLSTIGLFVGGLDGIIDFYFSNNLNAHRIEDYFEFLNLPLNQRQGRDVPKDWHQKMPKIEFRNVFFRYEGSADYTIINFNLTINSGEKIALIGLNGAGKTTLIKLLCGLYEPTSGNILIGDEDSLQYSQESLYNLFSVVFQDYISYEMSLYDTLSLGSKGSYSLEDLWDALDKVGGGNLRYDKFENNIDTQIGRNIDESGTDLSGGEKQKIALARSLLQDRAMVILDEPTSNLDVYAESAILEQFLSFNSKTKTTILVSHRLSAAKYTDKIILIKKGEIVESGSHAQLLSKNGEYADMWRIQSSQYDHNEVK